jgi:hypothetical protein
VDAVEAGRVYAAAEGTDGVFISENGGKTWNPANTGLADSFGHPPEVQLLYADPVRSGIVFAGTSGAYSGARTEGCTGTVSEAWGPSSAGRTSMPWWLTSRTQTLSTSQ